MSINVGLSVAYGMFHDAFNSMSVISVIPLSHYDHELHDSPRIDKLCNSWNSAKFMDRIVTFYELVTI